MALAQWGKLLKFLLLLLLELFLFSESQLKFKPVIHGVRFNPHPLKNKMTWLLTGGLWEGYWLTGGLFP